MSDRGLETPRERGHRFVNLAGEARELAAKTKAVEMREACLSIARSWLALASEVEGGGRAAAQPSANDQRSRDLVAGGAG